MSEKDKANLQVVLELLDDALEALREFPANYTPRSTLDSVLTPMDHEEGLGGVEALLAKPGATEKLDELWSGLPEAFLQAFTNCSMSLGKGLAGFGPPVHADVGDTEAILWTMRNPDLWRVAKRMTELNEGPWRRAVLWHLKNIVRIQTTHFSKTIITLLGEFALGWYAAPSQSGIPKLQLHEFSRDGWALLDRLRDQMLIEEELTELEALVPVHAKIVVALSWTIAALASFVNESIFLGEHHPRVSSIRGTQVTVSYGRVNREIHPFECESMRAVIRFCRVALSHSEIGAADMMWMAAGIARRNVVHTVHHSFQRPNLRYRSFLSHRGRDSKAALSSHLLNEIPAGMTAGAFLDCLCLPRRMVNRRFVFESLARSDRVYIVRSENYDASEWCRKEVWFAEQLKDLIGQQVIRTDLSSVIAKGLDPVRVESQTSIKVRPCNAPLALVADQANPDRQPNTWSLRGSKDHVSLIEALERLQHAMSGAASERPDEALRELFSHLGKCPAGEERHTWVTGQVEKWTVICQHVLMYMARMVTVTSPEAIWRVVDRLGATIQELCLAGIAEEPQFTESLQEYLCFVTAAAALDLWYDGAGWIIDEEISALVGKTAILRDRTLLLDVRQTSDRDLKLRLAVALISQDLGGFGILQNADDPVHHRNVDSQDLSVLPCVTMHPGMEALFIGVKL